MRPLSVATRLTLFFAVAAATVFPVFGWIISGEMEAHFAEGDTAELNIIADAVERALSGASSLDDLIPVERRFDDILIGHHHASLYIGMDEGQSVYASAAKPDLSRLARGAMESPDEDVVQLWIDANDTYRVMIRHLRGQLPALPDARTIIVATPIDYHLAFLSSFRRTLWLMVATSIVIMSLMGWLAVRQGHAPLREIVSRMRLVTANDHARDIPPRLVPRELSDLAASFNEMLHRMDEAFQRLANFNADIAHELRTPITNLMTQTQVALTKARTIDEYREILYSNMEEYERMAQMVGEMLFLAQADTGTSKRESIEVDLATEVRRLVDYYEGWAEERGVSLTAEGTAIIAGDRLMLQRALGNLLSNAIRHTPPGGTVRVALGGSRDSTTVSVENPGTPIPPGDLPKIFDRFYRVDPSRQRRGEGAGLGLAIVKSVVEAHGGLIAVTSNETFTRFRISLPHSERVDPVPPQSQADGAAIITGNSPSGA